MIDTSTREAPLGKKVRVSKAGEFLDLRGECGTVIGFDGYCIEVRMDRVTPEMEGFEDGKTGVLNFNPDELETI